MKVLIYRKSNREDPTEYKNVDDIKYWTTREEFIQVQQKNGYTLIPKEDIYRIRVTD